MFTDDHGYVTITSFFLCRDLSQEFDLQQHDGYQEPLTIPEHLSCPIFSGFVLLNVKYSV
jgi:hypothetical protein